MFVPSTILRGAALAGLLGLAGCGANSQPAGSEAGRPASPPTLSAAQKADSLQKTLNDPNVPEETKARLREMEKTKSSGSGASTPR